MIFKQIVKLDVEVNGYSVSSESTECWNKEHNSRISTEQQRKISGVVWTIKILFRRSQVAKLNVVSMDDGKS